jgi:hypothetical protein
VEFDAEVLLASEQASHARHTEVMARLDLQDGVSGKATIISGLHPRNTLFVDRDGVFEKLVGSLQPGEPNMPLIPHPRKSCTIHGIGGVGKTQVALEYAYRYMHRYAQVFWLRASSPELLASSILAMMRQLGIEAKGEQLDRALERGKQFLERAGICSPYLSALLLC